MRYLDLEHLIKKLDIQAMALSDYKIIINEKVENLDLFKLNNENNLNKLDSILSKGISISDFDSDLQLNLENVFNTNTDLTELVNRDIYLDNIKANKNNVYTKTEADNKLSIFYTKNEVDEKVNSMRESIEEDSALNEFREEFNSYKRDSDLIISSLQQQINELKAANIAAGFNIDSIEELNDITVEIGTDATENLQETILVTLKNGNNESIPVIWKTNVYNKDVEGTYIIEGIMNLPANISNSNNFVPSFSIIVNDSSPKIVDVYNIDDVLVEYETPATEVLAMLPNSVYVTLDNGSIEEATINWDLQYYSATSINDQTITGSLNVENVENVKNPNKLKATTVVKTIIHEITFADPVEQTYERDYSINFILPERANVTLDNGNVIALPVIWDEDEINLIDQELLGSNQVNGTFVDLPVNVQNPQDITTFCTVDLIENQYNIVSAIDADGITVPIGVTFENVKIEKQATVTLENGETRKCNVVWDGTDYDKTTPGTYLVYGDFELGNLKNFDNLRVSCTIVVSEDAEEYEWEYKFIVPSGASQIENFAQKLGQNTFTEEEFFGPYSEELEDYDYDNHMIELRYLGSTLQDTEDLTMEIDKTQIKKTGIIDAFGNEGLLIPYTSQSEELKDEFDNNVINAGEPNSNRSVDYYCDNDTLIFENKALSNQIYLIRKRFGG